jgi:hypothetical protein
MFVHVPKQELLVAGVAKLPGGKTELPPDTPSTVHLSNTSEIVDPLTVAEISHKSRAEISQGPRAAQIAPDRRPKVPSMEAAMAAVPTLQFTVVMRSGYLLHCSFSKMSTHCVTLAMALALGVERTETKSYFIILYLSMSPKYRLC